MMKTQLKLLLIILIVALIIWFLVLSQSEGRVMETDFLNVGQGDAILIKTPKNQTMLIDGGPDNAILEKLGKFLPLAKKN